MPLYPQPQYTQPRVILLAKKRPKCVAPRQIARGTYTFLYSVPRNRPQNAHYHFVSILQVRKLQYKRLVYIHVCENVTAKVTVLYS